MNGVFTVFTKYHGNGNDFIVFDLVNDHDIRLRDRITAKAEALCDRHRGIGGDGVIMVHSEAGQWCMTVINSDGSFAKNCGNGLRVLARYLAQAYRPPSPFNINLAGRNYRCEMQGEQVAIAMGNCSIVMWSCAYVSFAEHVARGHIGNDHVVFLLNDMSFEQERCLAEAREKIPDADEVNLGFLWRDSDGRLQLRVHERGAGWTKSCGTGAMVAAAFLAKRDERLSRVEIHQRGGILSVSCRLIEQEADRALFEIVQQGNAEEVFRGICQVSES